MITGIHLTPEEWLLAPWRPRKVLRRPAGQAFDHKAALADLVRLKRAWLDRKKWQGLREALPWDVAHPDAAWQEDAASFWIQAMSLLYRHPSAKAAEIGRLAKNIDPAERPSLERLLAEKLPRSTGFLVLLECLHGWPAVVEFARRAPKSPRYASAPGDDCFRRGLLPYLKPAELAPLREVIRARLPEGDAPCFLLHLAIRLGESDAIDRLPAGAYLGGHERELGFVSPKRLQHLRAKPATVTELIAWLANTGLDRLDEITGAILAQPAEKAEALIEALTARVSAPELAPRLLRLLDRGMGSTTATAWLGADRARTRQGLKHESGPLAAYWSQSPQVAGSADSVIQARFEEWRAKGMPEGGCAILAEAAGEGGPQTARAIFEARAALKRRPSLYRKAIEALGQLAPAELVWQVWLTGDAQLIEGIAETRQISSEKLFERSVPRETVARIDGQTRLEWSAEAQPVLLMQGRTTAQARQALDGAEKLRAQMQRRFLIAWRTGERWSRAEFERDVLGHPLLARLARLMLWAALDAGDQALGEFRVCDDGSLAGVDDRSWRWPEAAAQVELPKVAAARDAWRRIFADYDIIPLFDQFLADDLSYLTGDLIRLRGALWSAYEMRWLQDMGYAPAGQWVIRKDFPTHGVNARVGWDLTATDAVYSVEFTGGQGRKVPWRSVPPEVVHDVLADLRKMHLVPIEEEELTPA